MIEVQSLSKEFKISYFSTKQLKYIKESKLAVDDISFEVKAGEIFGFLGPNGAGKTTTIKMLTGILKPTSGKIIVDGVDIAKDPIDVKFKIGVMPEKPGFYEQMRGPQVLDYYGEFFGISKAEREKRIKKLFKMVKLKDAWHTKVGDYSFGMRKRLALAQALMHDPKVLILDEPSGGMDPIGSNDFRTLIKKLSKQGKTIFLSSHILPEVQQICDRVGILHQGKLVGVDTIPNLMKRVDSQSTVEVVVWADNIKDKHLEELAELEFIEEIRRYDLGVEMKCLNKDNVSAKINKELVKMGVEVRQLTTSQPDLEDIFMDLVKGGKKK